MKYESSSGAVVDIRWAARSIGNLGQFAGGGAPCSAPNVKKWLDSHSRFHLHFTPTSWSWLNLVERWFREITDKAIRRGVFHSINELITAIADYLEAHNDNPKPFLWTATVEHLLAKVARGRVALQQVQSQ